MLKSAEYYKNLVQQEPENKKAKFHLGIASLMEKKYKDGWKYFEYRLEETPIPDFFPLWKSEPIEDKTILVYGERGYGDTIMFSRYLPLLKSKCKQVLFLPQPELFDIFDEKTLGVKIIRDIRESIFDTHISIMSLPYKLGHTEEKDIPRSHNNQIKNNDEKVNHYKKKYFENNNLKVGINWQGCLKPSPNRAIPLEYFEKLFKIPNISFYSLQTRVGREQLEILANHKIPDLGSTFNDFSDTASAMKNLDLVISNDTSVANLAGTMEKDCWILLPFEHDWRWSEDISYCIWYKNAKLIKQNNPNNWDNVFDTVNEELQKLLV